MRVLCHFKLRFGLPLMGLWLLGAASAAQLDVTPMPVADSIPEGTANYIITFHVKNNTANFLLLDYALAVITHGGQDPDDFINFSGANGAGGLVWRSRVSDAIWRRRFCLLLNLAGRWGSLSAGGLRFRSRSRELFTRDEPLLRQSGVAPRAEQHLRRGGAWVLLST